MRGTIITDQSTEDSQDHTVENDIDSESDISVEEVVDINIHTFDIVRVELTDLQEKCVYLDIINQCKKIWNSRGLFQRKQPIYIGTSIVSEYPLKSKRIRKHIEKESERVLHRELNIIIVTPENIDDVAGNENLCGFYNIDTVQVALEFKSDLAISRPLRTDEMPWRLRYECFRRDYVRALKQSQSSLLTRFKERFFY